MASSQDFKNFRVLAENTLYVSNAVGKKMIMTTLVVTMEEGHESASGHSEVSMQHQQEFNETSLRRRHVRTYDGSAEIGDAELCSFRMNAEPALFLVTCALSVLANLQPLLLYWARCVEIYSKNNATGFPSESTQKVAEFCASLSDQNNTVYQYVVEKDISTMKIFLQMASGIPTLIVAPILGFWSDGSGGRKKPLLIGVGGVCFYAIIQLTAVLSYQYLNIYYVLFMGEAMMGLIGGGANIFTSLFTIVTDDSRHQMISGSSEIPVRITIASAAQASGGLVGNLLVSLCTVSAKVSIIKHNEGYTHAAIVGVAFSVVSFFYTLIGVKEVARVGYESRRMLENNAESYSVDLQTGSCIKSTIAFIYNIFAVILDPRPGWIRFCVILTLFAAFAEFLALDNQLILLYVKRYPFEWSDELFIYYNIMKSCIFTLGMVAFPLVFSKLHFLGKDSLLIIIGVLAASAQFYTISFAAGTLVLFLVNIGSFFVGGIAPGYRSLLSRMVDEDETARLFTALSLILIACPIFSSFIFNNIYNLTLEIWPGFVFFLSGTILTIVFLLQILIHFLMRPQWETEQFDYARVLDDSTFDSSSYSETLERTTEGSISESVD